MFVKLAGFSLDSRVKYDWQATASEPIAARHEFHDEEYVADRASRFEALFDRRFP